MNTKVINRTDAEKELHEMGCELVRWSDSFDQAALDMRRFSEKDVRKNLHVLRVGLMQTIARLDRLDSLVLLNGLGK